LKKGREVDPYGVLSAYFSGGNAVQILNDASEADYKKELEKVVGLEKFVTQFAPNIPANEKHLYMEFVLHALCEFDIISKDFVDSCFNFRDPLADALGGLFDEE
jgi:magnesium chelatase subunit I